MTAHIISALVKNKSGVLTRVSGLFARRSYNIDSLSVCTTEDPECSRMTIVCLGDEAEKEQVVRQLDKLIDVTQIKVMTAEQSIFRELVLVKVKTSAETRRQLLDIQEIFKAKIVDCSPSSMILELTGEEGKLNGFIENLEPFGILELARTGITAIDRGVACLKDLDDYNKMI